jgi:sporulation protein YlmC with PRC-barrel domain
MKPDGKINLVAELLDLPLLDTEGKYCGIVDDLELSGGPGKDLRLDALLVGPGAYRGRLPKWAMWIAKAIAGERITRVPIDKVRTIDSVVHLRCPAGDLGLDKSERGAVSWIPKKGAL